MSLRPSSCQPCIHPSAGSFNHYVLLFCVACCLFAFFLFLNFIHTFRQSIDTKRPSGLNSRMLYVDEASKSRQSCCLLRAGMRDVCVPLYPPSGRLRLHACAITVACFICVYLLFSKLNTFETVSYDIAQACPTLAISCLCSLERWDYKCPTPSSRFTFLMGADVSQRFGLICNPPFRRWEKGRAGAQNHL